MKEEVKNKIDEEKAKTSEEINNKNFERKIKNWKNSLARNGTISALKNKKYYVKPGVKKRIERDKNKKNARRNHNN